VIAVYLILQLPAVISAAAVVAVPAFVDSVAAFVLLVGRRT
jgi:hypothetical protein